MYTKPITAAGICAGRSLYRPYSVVKPLILVTTHSSIKMNAISLKAATSSDFASRNRAYEPGPGCLDKSDIVMDMVNLTCGDKYSFIEYQGYRRGSGGLIASSTAGNVFAVRLIIHICTNSLKGVVEL